MRTRTTKKQRTVARNLSGGDHKMRKILIAGVLAFALVATIGLVSAGYGSGDGDGPGFIDENDDGICDNFADEDGDGINDNCDGTGLGAHNRYRNGGGYGPGDGKGNKGNGPKDGTGYGPGNCCDN
jgi:hypothetical protein